MPYSSLGGSEIVAFLLQISMFIPSKFLLVSGELVGLLITFNNNCYSRLIHPDIRSSENLSIVTTLI